MGRRAAPEAREANRVGIWDISQPLSAETAVYPGDTPFSAEWLARIQAGDAWNLSTLRMSAHLGTHVDAPSHVEAGAADIASMPLDLFVGPCRLVELPGAGLIKPAELPVDGLEGVERLLLRSGSGSDHRVFASGYRALAPESAALLSARGLKLLGVDTPSVDPVDSESLPAHRALLRAGVAILENLDLRGVPVGDYELIALPLRIQGGEASPVRAILRQPARG